MGKGVDISCDKQVRHQLLLECVFKLVATAVNYQWFNLYLCPNSQCGLKVKVIFHLAQTVKIQKGSRVIALFFP
jgi:hypothetical protein